MGGGGGGGDDGVQYQREQEQARQARIAQGMSQIDGLFSQFGDDFYNQRNTAYQDYAMPQIDDQYVDQRGQLTYALARGGNLGSSLAAQRSAKLAKDVALNRQNVIDTGLDYANKARSDVATQKSNAVSLLQATADPAAAYNVAQSQAQALSAMPSFSPVGQVLQNAASGIGTYLNNQNDLAAYNRARNAAYTNAPGTSSGKVGS